MSAARHFQRALCVALALAGAAATAFAHNQPFSFLDLHVAPDSLTGRVSAHVIDIAHDLGIAAPDSLLLPAFTRRHVDRIRDLFNERIAILADGAPIRPVWHSGFEIDADRRQVALRWSTALSRQPGELRIAGPLFTWEDAHQTYVNVYESGALRHQDLLDRDHRESLYYSGGAQGVLAVARTFVKAGIHHIFIGPDHILFVVGLLLAGGTLRRLLGIVSAFTVAHSITLALATLGLVQPPPALVEPAIALSIVYVGVDNLLRTPDRKDARAWIAFGFGFVHGFGFASVLREFGLPRQALGWSLASFNIGVELGQACIVLAVAPVLAWLRARAPSANERVIVLGSWVVTLAGGYWFLQRVFHF